MTHALRSGLASILLLAGASIPFATSAIAQNAIRVTMGGPTGGGPGGAIPRRSIERYAELLSLSEEQKSAAMTIHDGYTAAFDQARQTQRDAMNELRRSAEDTGDHSVWMEKMPAIQKTFRDSTQKLETEFMNDLRAMLSPQQEPRWQSVERMRRREVVLRSGTLSGESMDLVEVVNAMKLPAEVLAPVTPLVEEYEAEMDRALVAKQKLAEETADIGFGGPGRMEIDAEEMQKAMEKSREASQRIQQVNERHARKIEGLLPEDRRAAFAEEVKKRSFPGVYRQSRVSRDLEAAMKFDDLSTDQRDQLAMIRDQYQRDAAQANERWAAAMKDAESSTEEGAVATPGGIMRLSMGDEPAPLVEARKARRELDDKAAERIKNLLNAAQRERLPKGPPAGEADGAMVGGMMIMETREDRR